MLHGLGAPGGRALPKLPPPQKGKARRELFSAVVVHGPARPRDGACEGSAQMSVLLERLRPLLRLHQQCDTPQGAV